MTDQIQKQNAPYAVAAMVLGICSIVFGCYFGIILGIIGLVLASKGNRAYNEAPDQYSGEGMLKAGKITSIIGIVFGGIGLIWIIYYLVVLAIYGAAYASLWSSMM